MLAAPVCAQAQDDERPGDARGDDGYAWGESGGGGSTGAQRGDDPLRVQGFAGAGIGFRLVRNLDSPFSQEFNTPAYFDFGAAVFLPGGDFRHGVSLFASTNLIDGANSGVPAGQQWSIAPGYSFLIPFQRVLDMEHDMLQLHGRVAIPLVFGSSLGGGDGVNFTTGLELGVGLQFKFLAGLGVYLEAQGDLYYGSNDTVHPTISVDAGLMIDYEVLP